MNRVALLLVAVLPAAMPVTASAQPMAAPPGAESGRIDRPEGPSAARQVGRALLFVPRGLFEIVMFPPRAIMYTFDRYDVVEHAYGLFFNDDGTIGLYPTLRLETGYGLNVGVRFVRKFGAGDRLTLFAGTGGRFRQELVGAVSTGDRLGERLGLELRGGYERRRNDRFYGLGNGDEVDPPMSDVPTIDPLVDDTAVETSYRRRIARATLTADFRLAGPLYVRGSGQLADIDRASGDEDVPIEDVYLPGSLVDFDSYRAGYAELELRWDSRGWVSRWEPPSVDARGWYAAVFGGRVALDKGPGFWRYGAEVQHYLRLAQGPRLLVMRAYGEAVTGERDEVPFTELPYLGGGALLRGYPIERFRDRVAIVGTLEYEWDLSRLFMASLFVDAGRVYEGLDELTFEDLRVGYGLGLEAHTDAGFVARVSVASSIDGGVFFNLYLDPLYEMRPRERRR